MRIVVAASSPTTYAIVHHDPPTEAIDRSTPSDGLSGPDGLRGSAPPDDAVVSAAPPAEALDAVLAAALEETAADLGAIAAGERSSYSLVAQRLRNGERAVDLEQLASDTVIVDALGGQAIVCVEDVAGHLRYRFRPSLVEQRIRAVACVPISIGRRVVGALYVARREPPRSFDADDLKRLQALAARAVPFIVELRLPGDSTSALDALLGDSPRMVELRRRIEKVGPTDLAVLVTGDTGTGKELTAQAIHAASPRRRLPLVAVNCAAISGTLLEAELFGCRRGAFTGATADRVGRIEAAQGSTLFLDEIGDMPLGMQAALLRALQEKEVVRLGENTPRSVDFRVIAATNKDLTAEVAAGRFREDLLFRLREVTLPLPTLSERGDDVLLLSRLFMRQCERQLALPVHTLSSASERALLAYNWPGNIRELRSTLRRAVVLSDNLELSPEDLGLADEDVLESLARPTGSDDADDLAEGCDAGDSDVTPRESEAGNTSDLGDLNPIPR